MNNYFLGSSTNNSLLSNSDSILKVGTKTTSEFSNATPKQQSKKELTEYEKKKNNIIELNKYKTIRVKRVVKKYEIKN